MHFFFLNHMYCYEPEDVLRGSFVLAAQITSAYLSILTYQSLIWMYTSNAGSMNVVRRLIQEKK